MIYKAGEASRATIGISAGSYSVSGSLILSKVLYLPYISFSKVEVGRLGSWKNTIRNSMARRYFLYILYLPYILKAFYTHKILQDSTKPVHRSMRLRM